MRILWNENEKQFEAQLVKGDQWESEKNLVSDADFKTDGPPSWVWHVAKAAALTKLKSSASALPVPVAINITRSALDAYNRLRAIEEKDAELKKFAKQQIKEQRRSQERAKIKAVLGDEEIEPEYEAAHYNPVPDYWRGKQEITLGDLPEGIVARLSQHESIPQRRAEPIGMCKICGDATYFPEDLDSCFWCTGSGEEKFFENLLDN
jgi:hypothetical protein